MQGYAISSDLSGAFSEATGYHGTCWIDLSNGELAIDREVPAPLKTFVTEVANIVHTDEIPNCLIGCAYMRIIEGSAPENYMKWHVDNEDGGVRFHTAIATDNAKVNLAWPDPSWVGQKVTDTEWTAASQPENGVIVAFTTEPHGVLPQPARPGEKTAVFFVTLYASREMADLYTTNNTATSGHAALPALEATRR